VFRSNSKNDRSIKALQTMLLFNKQKTQSRHSKLQKTSAANTTSPRINASDEERRRSEERRIRSSEFKK
jgi:hypothetical protein